MAIVIHPEDALEYHEGGRRRGKVEVRPTKPFGTQRDLSLAYTPGVAEPCRVIQADPSAAYRFTTKGNLVAVVSNGTAVLGLGNIGPLAGKPVMEGKAVLFKKFADIDVFDIELDADDPDEFIRVVRALEPTFGGINLEDIKAPDCFYIEEQLRKIMAIPVFHDDQHGTAIIATAAFLNALELTGRDIAQTTVVFSGAGAAAISCADLLASVGVALDNIMLVDSKGVIYQGREEGMNAYKDRFATTSSARTLAEAMDGADCFIGVSAGGLVNKKMVAAMAKDPIIFALANPDPEIPYPDVIAARPDAFAATGRSDFPNQVNNVLGFPFIFRGALDVRARTINHDMKIAAAKALAELAKQDVPDDVLTAYGVAHLSFGQEYLIPKPFDHRVVLYVAPAVAKAAIESGVADAPPEDFDAYVQSLERFMGRARPVMRAIRKRAQRDPKRLVFPEGAHQRVIRAAQLIIEDKLGHPILLGKPERISALAKELDISLDDVEIIRPRAAPKFMPYCEELVRLRGRKGMTMADAEKRLINPNLFAAMMVQMGDADGLVAGVGQNYPETLRPGLGVIGTRPGVTRVAGLYLLLLEEETLFFADVTVNATPPAEILAETALATARAARFFGIEPRVAFLSYSNFGSAHGADLLRIQKAVALVKASDPDFVIEGEMQAETALSPDILRRRFPFSTLQERANVFIFPNLHAGHIAYKLIKEIAGAELVGPILLGKAKPFAAMDRGATVEDIINMAAITTVEAQGPHPL